jgi:hypothetical protein
MDAFFYYFYNMMRHIFGLLWDIVIAIKDAIVGIFNIKYYIDLFKTYKGDLSPLGWVAAIVLHICEHMILPTYLQGTIELARMAFTVFSAIEIYSILENLRDITGLRAFDVLTLNFQKQLEEKTGISTGGKDGA